jgi:DNA-binding response OmpR family regulator
MKVLVIENDPVTVHDICNIMVKNRFDTILATTVEEAISNLDSQAEIGLIIADVGLVEKEGIDFVKYVNTNSKFSGLPILMCGFSTEKETILKTVKMGAKDYIVKPITPAVLMRKINKILGKDQGAILLVDDEKLILDLLTRILDLEGYETVCAQSGPDALNLMKSGHIGLVITDINMPVMDGFELMAAIKEKYPGTPVLLITGYSKRYRPEDVTASAADGFITKPFRNLEIIRKIKNFDIKPNKKSSATA